MTNRERVLALIRSRPGLTDSEIRRETGVRPHQQVNRICRKLESEGLIRRLRGPQGRIVNLPREGPGETPNPGERDGPRTGVASRPCRPAPADDAIDLPPLSLSRTLFVIPCSGSKSEDGGGVERAGVSILDSLPVPLANELRARRAKNASMAQVDESTLLPAARRYTGRLYRAAGSALDVLLEAGANIAIISGGYGVVLADEPIGWYDRKFKASMWPNGLVGRCLAAYAGAVHAETVVGLLSATTDYAKAFRKARWPEAVERVFQVSPEAARGAMEKAPRAQGEALEAIGRGRRLRAGWRSSGGLRMSVTKVR